MTVPVCAVCGGDVEGRVCVDCGADERPWKTAPLDAANIARRLVGGAVLVVCGLACIAGAATLCAGWLGSGLLSHVLQVLVAAVVVVAGVPVGAFLLWSAVTTLFDQRWTHPGPHGDTAWVCMRFGSVVDGSGRGRRIVPNLAVPDNGLRGSSAFVHYAALRAKLPLMGASTSPPRVDDALMASLLSLAGDGSVTLRVAADCAWKRDGGAVNRSEATARVQVQRVGATPGRPDDLFAEVWLRALYDDAPAPAGTLESAYRSTANAARGELPPGSWLDVTEVLKKVRGGDREARRKLRGEALEAFGDEAPPTPEGEAVRAELERVLIATGDALVGQTLLRQIGQGFAG